MKVLQLLTSRKSRGAEISAFLLSEELLKNQIEVWFVGLFPVEADTALTLSSGKSLDLDGDSRSFLDYKLVFNLRKVIKEFEPDIIQANGSDTWKYAVVALLGNSKPKLIYRNISILSYWLRDRAAVKVFYKMLATRVDYFCSVGTQSNADITRELRLEDSKTGIIRRGISHAPADDEDRIAIREKFKIRPEAFLLIQVGQLSAEKNVAYSLELVATLKDSIKDFRFLVVGTGSEESKLKGRVKELAIEDLVIFAGYQAEVGKMLYSADLLLLTSKIEGVPGVVVEAAFQGVPTIASDVGGVRETILSGESGVLIKDFEIEQYKLAVLDLYNHPQKRIAMGKNAFNFAQSRFSLRNSSSDFIALYESLSTDK
jgi:glycosyltransferase involved in cell wall biosynthesis